MKRLLFYTPYLLLFFIILGLGLLSLLFPGKAHIFKAETVTTLNQGWIVSNETIDTLPQSLEIDKNTEYTIERTLSSDFNLSQNLLLRTSLQTVEVRLDDALIYREDFEGKGIVASTWHVVTLPQNAENQTLSITFSSPYNAMSGTLNPIVYGETHALYSHIFSNYGLRLIIGLFTMLVGLLLMTTSLFLFSKENRKNMYLGLFAILLSFWIISESRMIQFFIGQTFIIGSLSYLALTLFPIPILIYIRNYAINNYKHFYTSFIVIFVVNLVAIITFHVTGFLDFFESVLITQGFLFVAFIMVIVTMVLDYLKFKNYKVLNVLLMVILLSVFAFFELIVFALRIFDQTSLFTNMAVGLIMLIMGINFIKTTINKFKLSYKKDFYERLAYLDPLTGANNRLAYEESFDQMFSHLDSKDNLRLLYFDLDDLKHINDNYGHLVGDEAIKETYSAIETTFGRLGQCYRIGGDEFACLIINRSEALLKEKKAIFKARVSAFNQATVYPFNISYGDVMYEKTDEKPSDMMMRADQSMYIDKRKHKKNTEKDKK